MTDKATQLYAMIEDQRMTLEAELKDQLEMNEAGEKRAAAIRAELAELPVRPVKRRKAAKNGRKAKKPLVTKESMTKVLTALDASLKADDGSGRVVTTPDLEVDPQEID